MSGMSARLKVVMSNKVDDDNKDVNDNIVR